MPTKRGGALAQGGISPPNGHCNDHFPCPSMTRWASLGAGLLACWACWRVGRARYRAQARQFWGAEQSSAPSGACQHVGRAGRRAGGAYWPGVLGMLESLLGDFWRFPRPGHLGCHSSKSRLSATSSPKSPMKKSLTRQAQDARPARPARPASTTASTPSLARPARQHALYQPARTPRQHAQRAGTHARGGGASHTEFLCAHGG